MYPVINACSGDHIARISSGSCTNAAVQIVLVDVADGQMQSSSHEAVVWLEMLQVAASGFSTQQCD